MSIYFKYSPIVFLSLLFAPAMASAQITDFKSFIDIILGILALLVPIIFTLALLYFFWGVAQFILSAGDTTKHEEGKTMMTWGIVALFVMFSVWGIIKMLLNTFGF